MFSKIGCVVVCQLEGFYPVTRLEAFTEHTAIPDSAGSTTVAAMNVEHIVTLGNGVRIKITGNVKGRKERIKGFPSVYVISCDEVEVLDDDYVPFSR